MPLIDIAIRLNVALEKALCLFGNIWLLVFYLLYLFEVVSSIHLPPPAFEEADMEGNLRTIERASHTHIAVMTEDKVPITVPRNVLSRTSLDTQITIYALICINLVEKRVDIAGNILRARHHR